MTGAPGPYIASVNAGRVTEVPWGPIKRSAIDKRAVDRPVRVHGRGLEPEEIADLKHHGGAHQAV